MGKATNSSHLGRNVAIVAVIAVVWVALDFATKRYFDSGEFFLGQHIAGPFLGLFRFTLVHNTGAAWGIFSGSTFALGVFSVIMCALLLVYLFKFAPDANLGQVVGAALVIGGGIGNGIDRFAGQYVVDFIDFTFMDFPVFNIADIGVTCGIVIFVVSMLVAFREEDDAEGDSPAAADAGDVSAADGALTGVSDSPDLDGEASRSGDSALRPADATGGASADVDATGGR